MGVFDRIRSLFGLNKEPETETYKEYVSCREMNKADIARFKKYVAGFSEQLKQYQAQGMESNSPIYQNVLAEIQRFRYSLYEAEKASKFIRENSVEDIEYRTNSLPAFPERLKALLSDDVCVGFHGTPIYFAEEILKSGKISSTADRFDGYDKSTDGSGQISVSDIHSLSRTVNFFLDVSAYQRCLPCGCLFVLNTEGQTETQRAGSLMDSVDFYKNPEKLLAVISTPENMENLKGWLHDAGLTSDLAFTFDDFVKELEMEQREPMGGAASKEPLDAQINGAQAKVTRMEGPVPLSFYVR